MEREVGKIVEVRGVSVRAELYKLLPPYIISSNEVFSSPRINSFVKTRVGLETVICQITGEYYDIGSKGDYTGYYLELTVKGFFEGNKFVQGLRLLPMVGAGIELLASNEFQRVKKQQNTRAFSIGKDLFDEKIKIEFDFNSMIPSHIGIFGNTGSGKSNTLAKIMCEYTKEINNKDNGRIIVFDINNEYGNNAFCEQSIKTVYELSTKNRAGVKIPIDYSELNEDDWCVLLNATEATQRPVVKTAANENREKEEYIDLLKRIIINGQTQLFNSIRFNLADYFEGIDEIKWHSISKAFYVGEGSDKIFSNMDGFNKVLEGINIEIPENKLERFMFDLYFAAANHIGYGVQYEFLSPLLRRAEKLKNDFEKVFVESETDIFRDKNVVVVQLADVNRDMLEIIPSIIVNKLFNKQQEEKRDGVVKSITNIVVDEAHNILYDDEQDKRHTSMTIDVFEKAIKEGRKYGLFLWVSSQRPSDISSTIISQMHNYFIHKLVNPNDLSAIRKSVAFLDQNAMDMLTVLGPGECIVSGVSASMPCFIKVDQLCEDKRPNSENIVLFGKTGIFE